MSVFCYRNIIAILGPSGTFTLYIQYVNSCPKISEMYPSLWITSKGLWTIVISFLNRCFFTSTDFVRKYKTNKNCTNNEFLRLRGWTNMPFILFTAGNYFHMACATSLPMNKEIQKHQGTFQWTLVRTHCLSFVLSALCQSVLDPCFQHNNWIDAIQGSGYNSCE